MDNKGDTAVARLASAPLLLRSEREHSLPSRDVRLSAGGAPYPLFAPVQARVLEPVVGFEG